MHAPRLFRPSIIVRRIAVCVFVLSVCVISFRCTPGPSESDSRPNIVIILADDMGIGDIEAYNPHSKIPTPHLNRLAAEGIRFTDAHSPSAVCTPTRYGVLTGRYAWRTRLKDGVFWGYSTNLIDTSRVTIPSLLKARGYYTGGIGKWHLGLGAGDSTDYAKPFTISPNNLGFDYYYGIPASLDMQPYVYFENDTVIEQPTDSIGASAHRRQEGGGFWRAGPIAPGFAHQDVLPHTTAKVVSFLEERAEDPDTPFFMYVPLSAPHTPWLPDASFRGQSGAGYYGDFAMHVDAEVGQMLDTMDRLGMTENTLVIFTSDNGAHWPTNDIEAYGHEANLHYRGQKADIWEGGHRVPFIARWPGHIPEGGQNASLLSLTDLLATSAAVVGEALSEGAGEDSYNMLPALLSEQDTGIRESIINHSLRGMFAMRLGDWKYIEGLGSGGFTRPQEREPEEGESPGQLFNLAADSSETENVYKDHPEIVAQLQELLDRQRDQGYSIAR